MTISGGTKPSNPTIIKTKDGFEIELQKELANGLNGVVNLAIVRKAPTGAKIKVGDTCVVKVVETEDEQKIKENKAERQLLQKEGSYITATEIKNGKKIKICTVIDFAPGISLHKAMYNTLASPSGKEIPTRKKIRTAPISPEEQESLKQQLIRDKNLSPNEIVMLNKLIAEGSLDKSEEEALSKKMTFDDMFLVQGKITTEDKLSKEQKDGIAAGLLAQLFALQQVSLVHCDLKPDNIQVHLESLSVKILDLGNAIDLESEKRHPSFQSAGFYAPPEAHSKTANSIQSDQYSLGLLIASLYSEKNLEQESLRANAPSPEVIMSDVLAPETLHKTGMDDNLLRIVQQVCQKVPEKRPESIGQIEGIDAISSIHAVREASDKYVSKLKAEATNFIEMLPEDEKNAYLAIEHAYLPIANATTLVSQLQKIERDYLYTKNDKLYGVRNPDPDVKKKELAQLGKKEEQLLTLLNEILIQHSKLEQYPESFQQRLRELATSKEPINKKIQSLSALQQELVKNNPPPILKTLEKSRHLPTIAIEIQQFREKYPKNVTLNKQLRKYETDIKAQCAGNSIMLQNDRVQRINQYPSEVARIQGVMQSLAKNFVIGDIGGSLTFSPAASSAAGNHFNEVGIILNNAAEQMRRADNFPKAQPELMAAILAKATAQLTKLEEKIKTGETPGISQAELTQAQKTVGKLTDQFNAVKEKGPRAPSLPAPQEQKRERISNNSR